MQLYFRCGLMIKAYLTVPMPGSCFSKRQALPTWRECFHSFGCIWREIATHWATHTPLASLSAGSRLCLFALYSVTRHKTRLTTRRKKKDAPHDPTRVMETCSVVWPTNLVGSIAGLGPTNAVGKKRKAESQDCEHKNVESKQNLSCQSGVMIL